MFKLKGWPVGRFVYRVCKFLVNQVGSSQFVKLLFDWVVQGQFECSDDVIACVASEPNARGL